MRLLFSGRWQPGRSHRRRCCKTHTANEPAVASADRLCERTQARARCACRAGGDAGWQPGRSALAIFAGGGALPLTSSPRAARRSRVGTRPRPSASQGEIDADVSSFPKVEDIVRYGESRTHASRLLKEAQDCRRHRPCRRVDRDAPQPHRHPARHASAMPLHATRGAPPRSAGMTTACCAAWRACWRKQGVTPCLAARYRGQIWWRASGLIAGPDCAPGKAAGRDIAVGLGLRAARAIGAISTRGRPWWSTAGRAIALGRPGRHGCTMIAARGRAASALGRWRSQGPGGRTRQMRRSRSQDLRLDVPTIGARHACELRAASRPARRSSSRPAACWCWSASRMHGPGGSESSDLPMRGSDRRCAPRFRGGRRGERRRARRRHRWMRWPATRRCARSGDLHLTGHRRRAALHARGLRSALSHSRTLP